MSTKSLTLPDVSTELAAAGKILEGAGKRLRKVLGSLDPAALPLGAAADLLYALRNLCTQAGRMGAAVEEVTDPACRLLEDHFVATLAAGESSGVQGRAARVQITESVIPVVKDWDAFYKYVARTKSFDLLNRAVNREAARERWDARKQVPGMDKFHAKKVSCTKLNGKSGATK